MKRQLERRQRRFETFFEILNTKLKSALSFLNLSGARSRRTCSRGYEWQTFREALLYALNEVNEINNDRIQYKNFILLYSKTGRMYV